MARTVWDNRHDLPYAWRILSRGVCDGCALGVAGFRDWTIEGIHLCTTRLYITGGLGPSRHNEGFTRDYDLPNETAYAETCAAIGFVFWNLAPAGCSGNNMFGDWSRQ